MKPFQRMNVISKYTPKIERMENHIEEHPYDYQTKIALAKLYGEEYEYVKRQRINQKRAEIAKYQKEQEMKYAKSKCE